MTIQIFCSKISRERHEKTEFAKREKINSASLAKFGKGANVTTNVLVIKCEELKCDISDICEIVPDEAVNGKE